MMPPAAQKTTPGEFARQVRQEAHKVTWPTRKETLVTTAMVFVMSVIAGVAFLVVDYAISSAMRLVLGLGG